MPFYQKQLRLSKNNYLGRRAYFVTLCTQNRTTFFSELSATSWLRQKLIAAAAEFKFALHAYCVMPDHVHFVCEGLAETCALDNFVKSFKQRTAYEFNKTKHTGLWQGRYYDHILRPNESIEEVACYIWWNPVRKALCAHPHHCPFSGSQTLDWMKSSSAAPQWQPPWKQSMAHGLQPAPEL